MWMDINFFLLIIILRGADKRQRLTKLTQIPFFIDSHLLGFTTYGKHIFGNYLWFIIKMRTCERNRFHDATIIK